MALNGFIHHIDHHGVWVAGAIRLNPIFNGRTLISRAQATNPTGRLLAPDKIMRFNRYIIFARKIINFIQRRPVILATSGFNHAPLAFVFRRNLVPVLHKIRTHRATGGDITDEFLRTST